MQNVIQVFARSVYGKTLVYPNNTQARRMADLLNVKTFTAYQLQIMLDMGFTVTYVFDPRALNELGAQSMIGSLREMVGGAA